MVQTLLDRASKSLTFVREFIKAPFEVGAIAPSSKRLARAMVDDIDFTGAKAVLEFGPGLGAFTQAILPRLDPDTRYLAIDINPMMVRSWRSRFPDQTIVEGSVADVAQICRDHGIEQVDIIISGLPWASFPDDLQVSTLTGVTRILRPGGRLVTFGYHIGTVLPAGRRFYKRLPDYFSRLTKSPYIWLNLPPAFVITAFM